jgi:hypothetical protein
MRTRFRLGLALVSVVVAVFVAGYAVAASIAPEFVGAGSTRYAMVARGPLDTTTTQSTTFVNVTGLSVGIGIPSGKSAELIITFSGEVNSCDVMYIRAVVDGGAAAPAETQLQYRIGQNLGADSHSFTFYKKGVGSGVHTVAIQWHGLTTCDHQFMAARSMVVTANIH